MLSMAKNILEDTPAWGMRVHWSQQDCLCFAWVQFLPDDSPAKEKGFKCFLATPSFRPAVLNILLLSAITGPKFPFYKVSPTYKNGIPLLS